MVQSGKLKGSWRLGLIKYLCFQLSLGNKKPREVSLCDTLILDCICPFVLDSSDFNNYASRAI
jgi:hypothetical protein